MSTQDTVTPWPFIRAVEKYFGIRFAHDMAADKLNARAPSFFDCLHNSLEGDWPRDGWCWLNPTFRNLSDWTRKCVEQGTRGARIVSVWPLSGDQNQIEVWKTAKIYVVHGRIWPLVRSCMLCVWGKTDPPLIAGIRWDKQSLETVWMA